MCIIANVNIIFIEIFYLLTVQLFQFHISPLQRNVTCCSSQPTMTKRLVLYIIPKLKANCTGFSQKQCIDSYINNHSQSSPMTIPGVCGSACTPKTPCPLIISLCFECLVNLNCLYLASCERDNQQSLRGTDLV